MATSPSRTRSAPPIRGTLWRSSQPTAGPVTAPSTAARMTGMAIVEVWPTSQMSPTMISTNPTSSHDVKPRSLSHAGAENWGMCSSPSTYLRIKSVGEVSAPPRLGLPPSGLGVTLDWCGKLGGVADRPRAPRLDDLSPRERSRTWRLRFTVREWLSRSLVLVPSLYIAAALALGELVPRAEGERDLLSLKLDPDTARTILSAEASGMIAFTGLVVSIGVVVVQFGASQYTPRLVSRFTRDPVVKHSLGIFIAPAIFALVSLRSIGRDGSEVVPSLTIGVNMILLIAAVLAFFGLVSRLLDLLRPRRVIAQTVGQASQAIREVYPFPLDEEPRVDATADSPVTAVVSHDGGSGVLSALDRARIVRAAAGTGAVVEVAIGIGGYVPQGAALFMVRGPVEGLDERELRRAAIVAEERTITQDPAFAIRAIVDIALRALSPAVNDPTTAVQVLDGLKGCSSSSPPGGSSADASRTRTAGCASYIPIRAGPSCWTSR